ncbi:hypothetical protein HYX08_03715 [Candidatus Woesearchaeota archaeon]|nr:hypothetical protein [Candidatus Woesearchaeota archaeon]
MVEVLEGSSRDVSRFELEKIASVSNVKRVRDYNDYAGTGVYYGPGTETYNRILDKWTDVTAKRKMENPLSKKEIAEKESKFYATIFETAEAKDWAARQLNYDIGKSTRAEIREVLDAKLRHYMWKKALLLHYYMGGKAK